MEAGSESFRPHAFQPLNSRLLRLLLHDELIHARKCMWMLLLEFVPVIEVGAGGIVRKLFAIARRHGYFELEADEFKPVGGEKILDLGDRETVFLDVEQEVAAIAGAVEIGSPDDGPFRRLHPAQGCPAGSA